LIQRLKLNPIWSSSFDRISPFSDCHGHRRFNTDMPNVETPAAQALADDGVTHRLRVRLG
jgi:hypothetical protein